MRRTAGLAAAVGRCALFLGVVACSGEPKEPQAPDGSERALYAAAERASCTEPRGRPIGGDSAVVLDQSAPYPCRLFFRETGIVLRGDSAGRWPDPGNSVARDSRGRFYTSVAGENSRIAVWNPNGSFDTTLGRPGQGPGELPPSVLGPSIHVDRGDRLFARGTGGQWTVFDSSHRFIGRARVFASAGSFIHSTPIGETMVLTSSTSPGSPHYFRLHSLRGEVIRAFGDIPSFGGSDPVGRAIVPAGDTVFWAGADHRSDQYTLEQWSTTGRSMRRLQRHVSWYRKLPHPMASTPSAQPRNVDGEGMLLVYVWVASDSWRWIENDEERAKARRFSNLHLEVIDPTTGSVLASEVVSVSALTVGAIPERFFPGTRLGYRYATSDAGMTAVHIVEYGLTAR
jgi:hypothetical protein